MAASSISTIARIELAFKLYPWEWMFQDTFGANLSSAPTRWIEPPWKAILSNKGILPLLWEMFPKHPNLLPAYFEDDPKAAMLGSSFVRKPLYSREGANVDARQRRLDADGTARPIWGGRIHPAGFRVRCRAFPTNTRCSEAGWSITRRADYRSARTKIRSPATRHGSCRTRSCRRSCRQTDRSACRRHRPCSACGTRVATPGRTTVGAAFGR